MLRSPRPKVKPLCLLLFQFFLRGQSAARLLQGLVVHAWVQGGRVKRALREVCAALIHAEYFHELIEEVRVPEPLGLANMPVDRVPSLHLGVQIADPILKRLAHRGGGLRRQIEGLVRSGGLRGGCTEDLVGEERRWSLVLLAANRSTRSASVFLATEWGREGLVICRCARRESGRALEFRTCERTCRGGTLRLLVSRVAQIRGDREQTHGAMCCTGRTMGAGTGEVGELVALLAEQRGDACWFYQRQSLLTRLNHASPDTPHSVTREVVGIVVDNFERDPMIAARGLVLLADLIASDLLSHSVIKESLGILLDLTSSSSPDLPGYACAPPFFAFVARALGTVGGSHHTAAIVSLCHATLGRWDDLRPSARASFADLALQFSSEGCAASGHLALPMLLTSARSPPMQSRGGASLVRSAELTARRCLIISGLRLGRIAFASGVFNWSEAVRFAHCFTPAAGRGDVMADWILLCIGDDLTLQLFLFEAVLLWRTWCAASHSPPPPTALSPYCVLEDVLHLVHEPTQYFLEVISSPETAEHALRFLLEFLRQARDDHQRLGADHRHRSLPRSSVGLLRSNSPKASVLGTFFQSLHEEVSRLVAKNLLGYDGSPLARRLAQASDCCWECLANSTH